MNKLIDYFVERSLLVNLITVLIILAGTFSMLSLDKETFPNVDFETIVVNTAFPGSTAQDVEILVSIPIERKMSEVDGIEELNVMSGEGYSIAVAKIDPNSDIDEVRDEIRNKIDSIRSFPEDVESPLVEKVESKSRPVMMIGLSGKKEESLRESAKLLRDEIEKIAKISNVTISGMRDLVFYVNLNLKKINEEELTIGEISRAIYDRRLNLTAGKVRSGSKTLMVRTFNDFTKKEDIESIVLRSNYSGKSLLLKDVADVIFSFKDATSLYRVYGEPAILLDVSMKRNSDIIAVTQAVKDVVAMKSDNEKLYNYDFMNESAFYVKRRLGILAENGILGIVLVFICLMFFLNFRVSVVTSLGAPLSFMVAFICMSYLGISLNLISMFGLILVLGMLVDDSIIVSENFYQKLEEGIEPVLAAKKAAKETLAPVTTTIITTIMAFGSLFLLGGIWGKFLWPVPAVVLICLCASWIECFFILPSHLADFVKKDIKVKQTQGWFSRLKGKYEKLLSFALDRKYLVVFGFILMFLGSIFVFYNFVDKEMFPDDDVRVVFYKIKGEVGTPIDKTLETIKQAEQDVLKVLQKEELKYLRSVVGSQYSSSGTPRTGDHYGMLVIYLTTQEYRKRSLDEIFKSLNSVNKEAYPGFSIKVEKAETGKPTKPPLEIEIFGDEIAPLVSMGKRVQQEVNGLKGVLSTEIDYESDYKQFQIRLNEVTARKLGVSNYDVALELRRAIEGQTVTELRRSDEDVDVILRLDKDGELDESVLDKIFVPARQGRRVHLKQVATIQRINAPYLIRRKNKKRVVTVYGEIDSSVTKAGIVNQEVDKRLKSFWNDSEMSYELGGEFKDTKDTQQRLLKSAIISLFLIFIVLVAQFNSLLQPLIVMSAIPFGLIGVIGIFWLVGLPIGFMALMGVIGLIGVVVNDSIVLVSFINNLVNLGEIGLKESVLKGSASRFRAVILTTFTTVAGILPIAHMPGGDPFLKPMAFSFAYGLLFSSTITLLFVPCAFYIYARFFIKRDL